MHSLFVQSFNSFFFNVRDCQQICSDKSLVMILKSEAVLKEALKERLHTIGKLISDKTDNCKEEIIAQ